MGIRPELEAKASQAIVNDPHCCAEYEACCAEVPSRDMDVSSSRCCPWESCCHEISLLTVTAPKKCIALHEDGNLLTNIGSPMMYASALVSPVNENSIGSVGSNEPKTSHLVQKRDPQKLFEVTGASLADVKQLTELYDKDYVATHMRLHGEREGSCQTSLMDWEKALGEVDFDAVITDIAESKTTKPKKGKSKAKTEPIIGLLKCTHKEAQYGKSSVVVGYLLYELRVNQKKQKFCEIVNVVVSSEYRNLGAGRLLYDHLKHYLHENHPAFATDLRLYVAEFNQAPRSWYLRLGFKDSGCQVEKIQGDNVKFLRMINELSEGCS